MAKKTTKRTSKKTATKTAAKAASPKAPARAARPSRGTGYKAGAAKGKDLVIVESPSKAKTINKYLGDKYVVLASVGHVRDLPEKADKGDKSPVPGVNLEKRFTPTYRVLSGKEAVVRELKKAASDAASGGGSVWFATDLDREGEAIAWHLAQEIGIDAADAKRVVFAAITKAEISKAFQNPHPIDVDKVNAQQARRILDRIVGYQVSPLLWKKVTRGLSAGRVQSVAVRLVVDREREIRAFVPDEEWSISASFVGDMASASKLAPQWATLLGERDEKGNPPTLKSQNAWLAKHNAFRAELVEVGGQKFEIGQPGDAEPMDLTARVERVLESAGLTGIRSTVQEDPGAKGPARWVRTISGVADANLPWTVRSIETKRTSSRPPAPFITSTLQQAASTRLGFGARRTMSAAQALYEGVDIPGEGPVGLITYMRTDSTHIAGEALNMAREHIAKTYGDAYLPEKPNFFGSSNKSAQEAHEAIRPTNVAYTPDRVRGILKPDQAKLYEIIWQRFVACQMAAAQWDATTILIDGGKSETLTFKATGRVLVFDGYLKVAGVPTASDEATLPSVRERATMHAFGIDPRQRFTSPPPRYTEASLIKTLESEGIGRPSTYASIVQTIEDRKYVEQRERRFHATDLGEVVTDKLVEAFPRILDLGYTREMEAQLDKIEEEHLDWIDMLERFYGPFKQSLEHAMENLQHAKAEVLPSDYLCPKDGAELVYRFGKNGRFLSCSNYPACNYACPVDSQGRPRPVEYVDVRCPRTGRPMVYRTGRFGPFIATDLAEGESPEDGLILNIDKKEHVVAPSVPALTTDLPCPLCEAALNLRSGARGPWLSCSRFPKCRGRGKWSELGDRKQADLQGQLEAHERAHPTPIITRLDGTPLTDAQGKPLEQAPTIDALILEEMPKNAVSSFERPILKEHATARSA
ncbi:MAG: type I DNA topoisomerase [Phycisphaeraceae bacterium]|nr:type I DNA topoisomerase [Phycisphaeraceae bacterium]